eukprot:g2634.t1
MIQTMGFHELFLQRHRKAVDEFLRIHFVSQALSNFTKLAGGLEALLIATTTVSLMMFVSLSSTDKGQLAITVAYALTIPQLLSFCMMMKVVMALFILSLERFMEYKQLQPEPEWKKPADADLLQRPWPSAGSLSLENASLVYRPGLPPALREISFAVPGGERIGIVGRTGAGKSSIMLLLFRIFDPAAGVVKIDGVNILSVGLHALRKHLSIIPQEPLLLAGSVRHNLDPFGQYEEKELAKALVTVGLDPASLDRELGGEDGSAGLSVGEAQLVSLARTLLRGPQTKICVMDEPTANIDMATDEKIQRVVREAFVANGTTLMVIAHRLSTIIDFSRILVMDSGQVAEYGRGSTLLDDPTSRLSLLVDALGPSAAAQLRAKAAKAEPSRVIESAPQG